jgi:hypothetical protein
MTTLLLWLLLFSFSPAAQDDGLTLSAQAGFDGLYEEQSPVPLVVSVRNDGPPVEGELRVAVGDNAAGGPLIYSAPILLPTGSDKRVPLVVHLPPFSGDVTVQLTAGDQVLAAAAAGPLNRVGRDELFYGVVSADPGSLAFLETIPGERASAAVAFLAPTDLPEVPAAWNGLDALVLSDVDTGQLSARQRSALRAWVESGGQLVVAGGPGGPRTAAGVADLLPVAVNGAETVADLPALSEFTGAPFDAAGPYVITTGQQTGGEALVAQDGQPILVRAPAGRGSVTFLALDPGLPPLSGWAGGETIWEGIAAHAPALPPWGRGMRDGYAASQAIGYVPGLRLPSLGGLLFFLFLYILIIGPINFLILRRYRRREMAWVTIPLLVFVFSAATFLTGFRTRGNTITLNRMTVAFGSAEAGSLRAQTALGLYSPRRGQYDVRLPYDATAFPFGAGFGVLAPAGNLAAIERAAELTLRDVRTDTSEVAGFMVESLLPRPAISARATLSGGGNEVEVVVRNDTEDTLEDGVILYGQEQLAVGEVAAGEERTVRLLLSGDELPAPGPTPDPLFPTGAVIPNPLLNDPSFILGTRDYFNDPDAYPRWQLIQAHYSDEAFDPASLPDPTEVVTLAGWLPGSAQEASVEGENVNDTGVTLLMLEIPVR